MAIRHVRDEEIIADAVRGVQRIGREASRPTGTERARTMETAVGAWDQSAFAKDLSEQLQIELGAAQAEITQALADSAAALEAAGLAGTEAADAVAAAQDAAADASQAIADALEAADLARGSTTWLDRAPVAADGAGKPDGAVWYQLDATGVVAMWELKPLGWVSRPFMEVMIPQIQIGSGTYGSLAGDRIVARSILADRIAALSITAGELAADSVTAVKIAAGAVVAAKIDAGAVTTEKLDALAVTAEKIAVGAIVAEKIAAGAITAGKIAATAIDGMTITGALIRTAASGQRLELTNQGLVGYGASGTQTLTMNATGDGLGMVNADGDSIRFSPFTGITYSSTKTPFGDGGIQLTPRLLRMTKHQPDNPAMPPYIDLAHSRNVASQEVVSLTAINVPLQLIGYGEVLISDNGSGGGIRLASTLVTATNIKGNFWTGSELNVASKINFRVGEETAPYVPTITKVGGSLLVKPGTNPGSGNTVTIDATGGGTEQRVDLIGNEIRLTAPKVTFQGDTEWISLRTVLGLGATWPDGVNASAQIRIKNRTVELRGTLRNAGNYSLSGLGTLPAAYRPPRQVTINTDSALQPVVRKAIRVEPSGLVLVYASAAGEEYWWFDGLAWSLDT